VSPDPAQGSSQSFTATLHYAGSSSGVPVTVRTSGANPQFQFATTDASGQATINYVGAHAGSDTASALSVVESESVISNPALVTWDAGPHLTSLTFANSPTASFESQPITVSANLTDVSESPVTPVSGQSINFSLGDQHCTAVTDANGNASCQLTPAIVG